MPASMAHLWLVVAALPRWLPFALAPAAVTCHIWHERVSISDSVIQPFSADKVMKANLIKMTHGLQSVL